MMKVSALEFLEALETGSLASDPLKITAPGDLLLAGDPIDPTTVWVRPELIAEVKYTGWSGSGRVRHGVYLGLREDKAEADVVRDVADPEAERFPYSPRTGRISVGRKGWHGA